MSVDELPDTRVGSDTTCLRLKDEVTEISLWYKKLEEVKKSILKSPTRINLEEVVTKTSHSVENKVFSSEWVELGGL